MQQGWGCWLGPGGYHIAQASPGSTGDGDTRLPRQGQPWDISSSTQDLLRTMAIASQGRWREHHRFLGSASSIPAQQRGDLGAGTREASHVSNYFIATGAMGQTQFPEGVWIQPLDPSNTVERMTPEPPRPCMGAEHPPSWPPWSSSEAPPPILLPAPPGAGGQQGKAR